MRSDHPTTVAHLIAGDALRAVFQPIVRFADGEILGYEALIRAPVGSALESPLSLLEAVAGENLSMEFERGAARTCIARFVELGLPGRIFLNYSASTIEETGQDKG